jgi:hypothetical protein
MTKFTASCHSILLRGKDGGKRRLSDVGGTPVCHGNMSLPTELEVNAACPQKRQRGLYSQRDRKKIYNLLLESLNWTTFKSRLSVCCCLFPLSTVSFDASKDHNEIYFKGRPHAESEREREREREKDLEK